MRIVAVGVSSGWSSDGGGVPFAASDARRFAENRGSRSVALCDGAATREAVRQALEPMLEADAQERWLVVVIAETTLEGDHFLVELADGPVDLVPLLAPLWESDRAEVIVALDLSRGLDRPQVGWDAGIGAIVGKLPVRSGRVLLLSDDGASISHVSGELQAGIWAYHLADAFTGRDPQARQADGRLTARSLQSYLDQEMDASLGRAFSDQRRQRSLVLASHDDDVLAEPPVEAATTSFLGNAAGLELRGGELIPVKQLGGFRKSLHKAPADALDSSREWVWRLAEPDLRRELEETTARLRQNMGFKRRQLRASGPTQGGASILTPDFAVHFSIEQSAEKPSVARLRRTLAEFRDVERLGGQSLAAVFPKGFSQLYQPFRAVVDIESLVDALEDSEPPGLERLDYPTDLAYCDLRLAGFAGRARIEPGGLTIAADGPLPPAELVGRYALVRKLLG